MEEALIALDALPEHYRIPIWLKHCEGLSLRDVAQVLGASENTIHTRLVRGIDMLRASLFRRGALTSMDIGALFAVAPLAPAPASIAKIAAAVAQLGAPTAITAATSASGLALKLVLSTLVLGLVALLIVPRFKGNPVAPAAHKTQASVRETGEENPPTAPASPRGITPYLEALLKSKIDVNYQREYVDRALLDIQERTGLLLAFPPGLKESFELTLEAKQIVLKDAIEKIADIGGLEIVYRDDTVALFKRVDDALLKQLTEKYRTGDEQARCEAVYDAAKLTDRRIYTLLFQAITDASPNVVRTAIGDKFRGLFEHAPTLGFGDGAEALVPRLMDLYARPGIETEQRAFLLMLCGATRSVSGADALVKVYKQDELGSSVNIKILLSIAFGMCRDERISDIFLKMFEEPGVAPERVYRTLSRRLPMWPAGCEPKMLALAARLRANAPKLRPPVPLAELRDLLKTDEWSASSALARSHDPRAFDTLRNFIKNTNGADRSSATLHLASAHNPYASDLLLELLKDPDAELRVRAAEALLNDFRCACDPRYLEILLRIAEDSDAKVRGAALESLGKIGGATASAIVLRVLEKSGGEDRKAAVAAALESYDPRFGPLRLAWLSDPDETLRIAAISELHHVRDVRAVNVLLARLKNAPAPAERRAIASALPYFLDDPRVLEACLALLDDDDSDVRATATCYLGCEADCIAPNMRDHVRDRFIVLLRHADEKTANNAAGGLVSFVDALSMEALINALDDPRADVSISASHTLQVMCECLAPELSQKALKAVEAAKAKHSRIGSKPRKQPPPTNDEF